MFIFHCMSCLALNLFSNYCSVYVIEGWRPNEAELRNRRTKRNSNSWPSFTTAIFASLMLRSFRYTLCFWVNWFLSLHRFPSHDIGAGALKGHHMKTLSLRWLLEKWSSFGWWRLKSAGFFLVALIVKYYFRFRYALVCISDTIITFEQQVILSSQVHTKKFPEIEAHAATRADTLLKIWELSPNVQLQ